MPRAVDLDQLPNAIPTMPRLMHRRHPLPPILPQPGRHHPLPDRLAGKINPVQLHELLARKRRPEVRIALADDPNDLHPQCRRIGPVARLPAAARHQCSSAVPTKYLGQPKHLATAKTQQSCRLRNPDPLLCQIAQNVHPIDLRTAHQNHRHRPPAPHPIRKPGRVTSRSGPTVTSLSGVYIYASREQYFGTLFFRNRPALELMRRLAGEKAKGSTLRIAVLACSAGAEVYSILWTIRSAR